MSNRLASYAEVIEILDNLPLLLRETRRARRLSLRAAAVQAGLAFSSFHAVERGENIAMPTILAVLRWLDPANPPAPPRRPARCGPNCTCSHAAEEYS